MSNAVQAVTVIGAGVMGSGIAQVLASAGCQVTLHDTDPEQLTRALATIVDGPFGLAAGVRGGRFTAAQAERAQACIITSTDLAVACAETQVVVEAVPEDIGLKVAVFRQLDRYCPPNAILTSNTGGLPIAAMAAATDRPQLVLGWHFSQPVPAMALAEIAVHMGTDSAAVATITALARRCGKNPIVITESQRSWGFVANRINRAVRSEAARIVEEGVATRDEVDQLIKDAFRWPMGPFEMEGAATIGGTSR